MTTGRSGEPGPDEAALPPREVGIRPGDPDDAELLSRVRPSDWTNPRPKDRYDLVVVGGGTAGLVCAAGAAGLGARVALVERDLLGGDCLNTGCVPSKAILAAARLHGEVARAASMGLAASPLRPPAFAGVFERMRRVRAGLARNDSADRFRSLGVDVFLGEGRFGGPDHLRVDDRVLRFRRAVIATGARAAVPGIPGLADAGFRTNADLFALPELPARLLVLGGGPIGCEMAQAFRRLGSAVTILEAGPGLLAREDPEAAAVIAAALVADGVRVEPGARALEVRRSGDGKLFAWQSASGGQDALEVDEILVATGRRPNVETLGLDAAGVESDDTGVRVDDRLRTTSPRIFAAGDVCLPTRFTHAADASARLVLRNALFGGRSRASALPIPRCTYTDPELAHVGVTPAEAAATAQALDTITVPLDDVDRAVLDGDTRGFMRVHLRRGTDRIAGATVVGRDAGDLLAPVILAMAERTGMGRLAGLVLPYPTRAEALRKAADAWNRGRLTPVTRRLLSTWFRGFRALT